MSTTSNAAKPVDAPPAERRLKAPSWATGLLTGSRGPALGLVAMCVVFYIATPYFLTQNNLLNIVDQAVILGLLALGMTAVIITGGIDLSVGAVLALATMVLGFLSHDLGWPLWLSALVAIGVAGACGLANGLGVTFTKLPPFIATLAMMSIARGLANVITDGQQIVGYPEWFGNLSTVRYLGVFTFVTFVLVVLYVAGWAYMRYRTGGRELYAIGGSSEVARLAGISVRKRTVLVYTVTGVLVGLAGVFLSMRLDSSQPSAGTGYELDAIAAVVIGGASLSGGVGSVTGTLFGVLIIGVLHNGLNLLGVSPFVQQIVIGVVIALAVMVDVLRRRETR
ncbi:ABC transporter permease [Streptomyces sp. DSM 40750]|uniref:ABC transporter permease n=1 Tax=Streptomyces sp. DSM 40750 TaxID=2801030 RepID=UPI00214AFA9F|nr:ABC transporter permease [Streptomyces sp. DSM 40750]UUU19069.1 ABC transporter permease [Streptomyces sp. DSM 40750]UUU27586.1 ABC transporter permease [Streptomyces sp. DSM 40750]